MNDERKCNVQRAECKVTAALVCFALCTWHLALAAPAEAQSRLVVHTEPGTPVIATEVLVAAGPADEPEGRGGLAYLAARAVTAPLQPALDSLGAHLVVQARKDALSFSLAAAPDAWPEAMRVLLVALFRDPPDSLATLRERQAVRAELLGREPNPADAVTGEADAALFGREHPWGRGTVGTPASVASASVTDVDRFLRAHFLPQRTVVAVVGPVERATVEQRLRPLLGTAAAALPRPRPPAAADSVVRRDYNSITTWVSASYPFPAGADVEAVRLVAHLATEALAFGPRQHSVYNVRSDVIPRLGGGELRLQVVVPPAEAELWRQRVEEAVTRVATRAPEEAAFRASLRRYRGERLLALAAPEDRAREAARRLLLTGSAPALLPDLEALSLERLRDATRSLGPPTIVFLGPILDDDDDTSPTKGAR